MTGTGMGSLIYRRYMATLYYIKVGGNKLKEGNDSGDEMSKCYSIPKYILGY